MSAHPTGGRPPLLVLALSTPVQVALVGFAGVAVTAGTGVLVAMLNHSVKAEAHEASDSVDTLAVVLAEAMERITKVEDREQNCLEALSWAHGRIVLLENRSGLPSSPPPLALQHLEASRRKKAAPAKKAAPKRRRKT